MRSGGNGGGAVIHPSAIVDKQVALGEGCEIGPFCVIDGVVKMGARCRLKSGVVIGAEPMDRNYCGESSAVVIGADNLFFEFVTVHRATGRDGVTEIGDNNYIMSYVHIAHNCRIGSNCTLTSGVQLGGYVQVDDYANIGGLTGVHQFCRIGRLAMVGAHSYVNRDIPPFMLAAGNPCRVRGINVVGLQRAGYGKEKIEILKEAFRIIYRSCLPLNLALKRVEDELLFTVAGLEIRELLEFCNSSVRGIELRTGRERGEDELSSGTGIS